MTDHHEFTTEVAKDVDEEVTPKNAIRIRCSCGWIGVWMRAQMPDANDVMQPTRDYIPFLISTLRPMHPDAHAPDPEEVLYQKVLARLQKEGLISGSGS